MDLTAYLSQSIRRLVDDIFRATAANPRETAFMLSYMRAQKKAAAKRERSEAGGLHIPPFLIASVASSCNLHCAGCYARASESCGENRQGGELSASEWQRIFREAARLGVSFILLAGGEPMMRRDVLEAAAPEKEIIFPVFTNGTLFGNEYLALFDRHRNLVPVLSIEGGRDATDARRGAGTYDCLMRAMEALSARGILFGASVTLTTANLREVTSDRFIEMLADKGCGLTFYVEYVPADGVSAHLAPGPAEREALDARLAELRRENGRMLFLSFPGDEKDTGGCLAAGRGFFHINPSGGAEPCPFSPFSDFSLKNHTLAEALRSPLFARLAVQGLLDGAHTGGCVLFGKEIEVRALLAQES